MDLKDLFIGTNTKWFLIRKKKHLLNKIKKTIWEMLDSSFEGVKKLFFLFYDDTNSNNVDVNSNGK